MQTSDTWRIAQEPKWETMLEVCCTMPQGITFTQVAVRGATEAVEAIFSAEKHGEVMAFEAKEKEQTKEKKTRKVAGPRKIEGQANMNSKTRKKWCN